MKEQTTARLLEELGTLLLELKSKHSELRRLLRQERMKRTRAGPARAQVDETENRDALIKLRVSPSEKRAVEERAEKAGLEVSEFVRRRLLG